MNGDVVLFTSPLISDDRGYFTTGFNKDNIKKVLTKLSDDDLNNFVYQYNMSLSAKNVVRGLHYQIKNTQAKLVSCIQGSVIDIIVDLRQNSKNFKKAFSVYLNAPNMYLYVPKGFAHGFISLEDNTIFSYIVDDKWNKKAERGINFTNYVVNYETDIFPINFDLFSFQDYHEALDNLKYFNCIMTEKDQEFVNISEVNTKDLFK